jgi:hypothetical protein
MRWGLPVIIYCLEEGEKRWIVDIEAFEAEGHVWEDVHFTSCGCLQGLLDGKTIPLYQPPAGSLSGWAENSS